MTPRMFIYGFILLALISGAIWMYTKGGSDNQTKTDLNNATDYIEGTKDATDAKTNLPGTDDGNIEWLSQPW